MNTLRIIFLQFILISWTSKLCSSAVPDRSVYQYILTDNSQQKQNCICYENNKQVPLVSEILKITPVGIDRLVVYLYRERNTQNISMYIPNHVKQGFIPDMFFESNDSLTYPSSAETIFNMVNKHLEATVINHQTEDIVPTIPAVNTTSVNSNTVKNSPVDLNFVISKKDEPTADVESPKDDLNKPVNIEAFSINLDNIVSFVRSNEINRITDNDFKNSKPNIKDVLLDHVKSTFDVSLKHDIEPNVPWNKDSSSVVSLLIDKNMNKWIEKHTVNIDGSSNTIDIDFLRQKILNTLTQNGISITPNGKLIDSVGSLLQPSSIVIRLILLDGSVGYDRSLHNVVEALVISRKNTSKVLGSIPLKKNYILDPIKYSIIPDNLVPAPPSLSSTITKAKDSVITTPMDLYELDNKINLGIPETNKKKSIRKPRMNNFMFIPSLLQIAPRLKYPVKNDISIKNQIKNRERKTTLNRFPGIAKTVASIAELMLLPKKEDDLGKIGNSSSIDEEGLGIRIIGGSAATGSGTPVSSRGRSAKLAYSRGMA